MREDIFANSEVVPAAFEPPLEGVEPDPSKGCVPDASPTAPVEPEDPGGPPPCLCARVFAARSAAAANSRVRSFTDADIAADISPSSLVDEGSRDADEFPVERCGRDGLGYAEAPDAAPGRAAALEPTRCEALRVFGRVITSSSAVWRAASAATGTGRAALTVPPALGSVYGGTVYGGEGGRA